MMGRQAVVLAAGWLLCAAVCLIHGVADVGDVESARCRVRCLAHLKHKLGALHDPDSQSSITFARCFVDPACTACVKPCGQPVTSLAQCFQVCQDQEDDCEQSCRFLKHVRTVRPGTCPRPEDASQFEAACVENCQLDGQCEGIKRCCDNGCGYTCQTPKDVNIGVPDIPRIQDIRERAKGGSVELSWDAVYMNFSAPLLYMVQHRWNVGRHHSEHHMTQWHQVSQTTHTATILRDIGPGRWYQFRVSSVSVNGSRGFSEPSDPFKVSKEPQAPASPENLIEGDTRIQSNRVTVTVHWRPPKKSDLPVSRYKVYWSRRLKSVSAQLVSLREHKKALPGDQLTFDLEDLDPDTTYFVQVQAISQYGDMRLKGDRASIYITTYALPQATQNGGANRSSGVGRLEEEADERERGVSGPTQRTPQLQPTPPPLQNLTLQPPYFQNGLLKANVTWAPPPGFEDCVEKSLIHWTAEVCIADTDDKHALAKSMSATTHDTYFLIYDLRFDCRYVIKVQPVCNDGQLGPVSHMTFKTPSCGDVHVQGDVLPDCPTNMPGVPEEPPGLTHTFLIKQTNITARVNWREPRSDAPITGYRIIWGQTLESPDDSQFLILDQNTALTKVLSKVAAQQAHNNDMYSFNVGSLLEATTYLVRLQAISRAGSGQVSSIHFRTPMLQSPPPLAGPPYKQDEEEKGGSNRGKVTSPPGQQPAANVVILGPTSSVAMATPQHRKCTVTYAVLAILVVYVMRLSLC